jgi:hypothetical protein
LIADPLKPNDFKIPTKGKVASNNSMKETLKENLKDWGKYGDKYILQALL